MSEKDKTYFGTFYKVARVINSSLDPDEVLEHIVKETTLAMEAKGCTIRLLGNKGDVLLPKACFGLSQCYLRKGPVLVGSSKVDQEVLTGHAVTIEDPGSDPRFQYPGKAREEGLGSILILPLTTGDDRTIGVLRVYDAHKRVFTQEEQDFAMAIAHLSALAIQNARMHEQLRKHVELVKAYQYQVFED
ncbi:GAF domain-containing protein [Desulfoplanes formicivorans]|uniref:Cyclic diguanylate phosphodiesterase n=1 Tax=Desulfoplanes formicivorans TaxID=1592317 RepID=A0A194AJS9_9BACT|nr:GAF domain-containing protein [Desulfoplanes formicivorans]GAU09311.1 cyclic diguanylate phosphodiesterase [Desulfoplanes formicivorans]